jgi:hypothetical protein
VTVVRRPDLLSLASCTLAEIASVSPSEYIVLTYFLVVKRSGSDPGSFNSLKFWYDYADMAC